MQNSLAISPDTSGKRGNKKWTALHQIRNGARGASLPQAQTLRKETRLPRGGPKVKIERLGSFARELATLVDAGIQLNTGIGILAQQTENKEFAGVLKQILRKISAGQKLSKVLMEYPKTFPTIFVSLVKAGEATGGMNEMLNQVATYLEEEDRMRKKVKSATTYPKFILGFFSMALVGVMIFLIPHFKEIFDSFDAELPAPTLLLMDLSTFIKTNAIWELLGAVGLYSGFKAVGKTRKGRKFFDGAALKFPLIGSLVTKILVSKFAATLSTLMANRVSLVEALEIAGETTSNVVFKENINSANVRIKQGKRLSASLEEGGIIPPIAVNMIAVGEEVGALDIMLGKVAEFYKRQLDERLTSVTSLLEPLIMVLLGGLALVIVIALYLPIFKISGNIH